jgi:diguanylate cyclase (GGDEF)-like protein
MRQFLVGLLLLVAWLRLACAAAPETTFDVSALVGQGEISASAVADGSLDSRFRASDLRTMRERGGTYWLRVRPSADFDPGTMPALIVRKSRHVHVQVFEAGAGERDSLPLAAELPGFRGTHEAVYVLPGKLTAGKSLYARVQTSGRGSDELRFTASTLRDALERSAAHARMIALTFGGLMAMAIAALLIWFVLADKLLLLYATLFSLQALYMAFLSGQGFDWPLLSYATPFMAYTWNVSAALSGAAACLFVREIAELRRFSPRVYNAFGWLAWAFVLLTFANLGQELGFGPIVVMAGNLIFIGSAIFTLVVAFLAWRRDSRAAGWFLLAWGLLEAFTIATALRLLFTDVDNAASLLYYGLPLSMLAAAVLIALGVADRLRDQRMALFEAERKAQTDPLTGVLNRRSLMERLETACLRARARGLPIALLFIDLDHFKGINDSRGHQAGDACLKAIIDPIQAELRQSDAIGRYGGEEFIVILSGADAAAAEPIAERIRGRVADVRIDGYGAPIKLTCSIGVATSDMLGVWGEHLIARADEAVYAAKKSGRNRVQLAASVPA